MSRLFIVPCDAAATRSGAAWASAPRQTSATRWLTSTLPAPTAAGNARPRACRPARRPRPGAARRRWPGSSGRRPSGGRRPPRCTVTASTALTLPAACGSVPVKSKRDLRRPSTVTVSRIVAGCCWSAPAPVESSTSSKRPRAVGQVGERGPHPPLAVGDHLVEGRAGQSRASRCTPDPVGAHLRVEVARSLVGGPRRGEHAAARTSGVSRTGGMRRPSCWISVASAGIDPGAAPPRSAWWARLATQPTRRPSSSMAGATTVMSLRWVPPAKGSLRTTWSPGCDRSSRARRWRRPPRPASTRGAPGCARPAPAACRRR